jgi:catechol 2,3-dioxygenase-like lactoylglutathione lyase family enzyme
MSILLQSPTPNLPSSLDFYLRLGFRQVSENPLILTDGKVFIEINPDRYGRAGIKLFRESWKPEIQKLQEFTAVTAIENSYLLSDPSGVWIFLMEFVAPEELVMEDKSFSVLGNYAGLSLETTDIQKSKELYEALGFTISGGSLDHGYISLENNGFTISLMKPLSCPHLFFNPSMTYFNGTGNIKVIEKIRKLNIPITEEITHFNNDGLVDNIIIRDPGGFGFFIFSD